MIRIKELILPLIPRSFLTLYHSFWAILGVVVYRNPSKYIKVIGVTGTNGKTSAVHISSQMLEKLGLKVASISTVRFKLGDKEWDNGFKMTMPGRMVIQKFFRDAVKEKCDVVIMELTSEGSLQNRHLGINLDTVAFTNLTPEHIERHGSFDEYRAAKGKFFAASRRVSIINADDENADYFASFENERTIMYSQLDNDRQDATLLQAKDKKASHTGISFTVEGVKFHSSLLGEFNIGNSLASICVCVGLGFSLEEISAAFKGVLGIPGRAEIVLKEPTVIVDYAHTPDGLEKIYKAFNVSSKRGRKICVLGSAGGGRDKWKRPEMGLMAERFCDIIILTDEDSYRENPMTIVCDIKKGIKKKEARIIIDRREAIKEALLEANKEDIVFITGKGSETLMVTNKGKIDWDDRRVVSEEMKKIIK